MNAEEAKKMALAHKKQIEENLEVRKSTLHKKDVDLLLSHFYDQIEKFVKKGKLSTDNIEFDNDRFSDFIVSDVNDRLTKEGYNLIKSVHNAYNKVTFIVSWST